MKRILFPAALFLGLIAISCNRSDGDSGTCTNTAGTGGPATLRVSAVHHTATIDSGTVRIKYNPACDDKGNMLAPAEGAYEDSVLIVKSGTNPAQATFANLKAGRYYLSARAYDNNVVPGRATLVVGGIPYTITDTTVGRSVVLPVTEADGNEH